MRSIVNALQPQEERVKALKAALGAPMPHTARKSLERTIRIVQKRILATRMKFWSALSIHKNLTMLKAETPPASIEEMQANASAAASVGVEATRCHLSWP